ncbi:MAG: RICIN domain-containing protein [Bacteroidota bacterium]|nr:RICIN domain-containing protein [Bacteroidota bacterium]
MKKLLLLVLCNFIITAITLAQSISGTYAIQNTATHKNLRPYEAGGQNGNRIVLYNHVDWKCMTWKFIHVGDSTYQLQNLFTSKTFQPKDVPAKNGTSLEQQPLSSSALQQWEFIKASNNSYYVRLKGTRLYITASSAQTNSDIILQEKQSAALQLWSLVAQNPSM